MNSTISFEELQKVCKEREGSCIFCDERSGIGKFSCAKGHRWEALASRVLSGEWCQRCARAPRKITIDMLRDAAEKSGKARLCSTEYSTLHAKYELECLLDPSHKRLVSGSAILYGNSGCRKCAGIQRRVPIEVAKNQIEKCGFVFVRLEYKKSQGRYLVRCQKTHEWMTTLGHLREGKGCPYCSQKARHTIQDAVVEGGKRELICLSKSLTNNRSRLDWQCKRCDHKWSSSLVTIMNSIYGCPECGRAAAAEALRLPIEKLRAVAREKGGRLKTQSYVRGQEKLEWECAEGHVWRADTYSVVTRGQWCAKCYRSGIVSKAA